MFDIIDTCLVHVVALEMFSGIVLGYVTVCSDFKSRLIYLHTLASGDVIGATTTG